MHLQYIYAWRTVGQLPMVAGGWAGVDECGPDASMTEFRELQPTGGVSLSPLLLLTTCISIASNERL